MGIFFTKYVEHPNVTLILFEDLNIRMWHLCWICYFLLFCRWMWVCAQDGEPRVCSCWWVSGLFSYAGLQVEVTAAGVTVSLPAAACCDSSWPFHLSETQRVTSCVSDSVRFCLCGVTAIYVFFHLSVWGPRVFWASCSKPLCPVVKLVWSLLV